MSTYLEKLDYLDETKDLIREAIVAKGVSVSDTDTFRDYADKIGEISGGGTPEIPRGTPLTREDFPLSNAVKERRIAKPFTFYDYDGTVLGQYTKAQIDAMTSEDDFPAPIGNNIGDGIDEYPLTFVGWNWTLEELKTQPYGINVGAIYAHVLENGYQSPLSVFMDVTEEVTFNMKAATAHYLGIKNRSTGEITIPYWKGTTAKSVTLPIGKYVVLLSNNEDGSVTGNVGSVSSLEMFTDTNADKYIKGVCVGNTCNGANGSYIAKHKLPIDFICSNAYLSSTSYINLGFLECDFAAYAKANAERIYCANSRKLSFNTTKGIYLDNADKVEELLIPTTYTTSVSVQLNKAQNLKEIYIPCEFSGNDISGIEAIYIEDNSKITANLGKCDCEELYIPDYRTPYEIYLYQLPNSLKKLRLPSNTTRIAGVSSSEIRYLESIYLPDSLTTIGEASFKNCKKLKTLYVPDSVQTIGKEAFCNTMLTQDTLRLPENVKISPTGVFAGTPIRKPWKDFELSGTTNYGLYPGCCYLEGELVVPETITSLNTGAEGNGATYFISQGLAADCHTITKVVLPNSITEIPNYSFSGCISLEEVNIPINTTKINQYAFQYCRSLKEITLPETLTQLGKNCFNFCTSLKKVILPDSVTSLGSGYTNSDIFSYCRGLEEITLSNTLKSIASNTFAYCSSLTSITIPASVSDMNGSAIFNGCTSLIEYHMKPTTPPTLNSSTFGYSSMPNANARIYVPYSEDHSILAAYKAATNWSKYASIIVEEEPND